MNQWFVVVAFVVSAMIAQSSFGQQIAILEDDPDFVSSDTPAELMNYAENVSGLNAMNAASILGMNLLTNDEPAGDVDIPIPLPNGGVIFIRIWIVSNTITDKFPDDWTAQPNRKKIGYRWLDPENPKGNGVRIDKGDPNSPFPSQQVDHVIVRSGGVVIGRDGNPIDGAIDEDPENSHIPLSE